MHVEIIIELAILAVVMLHMASTTRHGRETMRDHEQYERRRDEA